MYNLRSMGSFNNTVSSSHHIASNGSTATEENWRGIQGSGSEFHVLCWHLLAMTAKP